MGAVVLDEPFPSPRPKHVQKLETVEQQNILGRCCFVYFFEDFYKTVE